MPRVVEAAVLGRRITVAIGEGLHARPAALFVQLAGEQLATVTIRKVEGEPVATNSILAIMTLGVGLGDEVVLEADGDGDGAQMSLDALAGYLTAAS